MFINLLFCCSFENGRRDRYFCFLYLYLYINLISFVIVFIIVFVLLRMIFGARYFGVLYRVYVFFFIFFAKLKFVILLEKKI